MESANKMKTSYKIWKNESLTLVSICVLTIVKLKTMENNSTINKHDHTVSSKESSDSDVFEYFDCEENSDIGDHYFDSDSDEYSNSENSEDMNIPTTFHGLYARSKIVEEVV